MVSVGNMNTVFTLLAALCALQTFSCDTDESLVQIEQGWLQGKSVEAVCKNFSYWSFENIPYAPAPVGELRFKAPQNPESWDDIRDATALGNKCSQWNAFTESTEGSEDCLTVDVYTSSKNGSFPVMVIFSDAAHAFNMPERIEPDFFVEYAVVVTVNSRLGASGFLNLDTADVPGNAGLKDQVAALEWVNQNIANFGGNPESVTLVGISAGSAAIVHHLMSPMSSGLFHKAVLMSGTPYCDAVYPHTVKQYSYQLAEELGYDSNDENDILSYLQDLPNENFVNSSYSMAMREKNNVFFKKMVDFVPVVENDHGQQRFKTDDISTAMSNGLVNKVDCMIGYTNAETLLAIKQYETYLKAEYENDPQLFVPNKIIYGNLPSSQLRTIINLIKSYYFSENDSKHVNMKDFVTYSSHINMIYDVVKLTEILSQLTTTYLFKFSSVSKMNAFNEEALTYGIDGAAHADPQNYLFTTKGLDWTDTETTEYKLVKQFRDAVLNFVLYSNPTPDADSSSAWPVYTPERPAYVEFTDTMTVKEAPESEAIKFWDFIYSYANVTPYL